MVFNTAESFGHISLQFQFISLSTDSLQGQRPHGYRNSQTIKLYMQVIATITKLAFRQLTLVHRIND